MEYPYRVKWRLTVYYRGRAEQPHSLVSVDGDTRFSESLVAALIDEWERMAPAGLSETVVERGTQLIREAARRFARQRAEQPRSVHTLDDAQTQAEQYELRADFCDREGFVDDEGVDSDYARATLLFTLVEQP
jgi:hypothetical protein